MRPARSRVEVEARSVPRAIATGSSWLDLDRVRQVETRSLPLAVLTS